MWMLPIATAIQRGAILVPRATRLNLWPDLVSLPRDQETTGSGDENDVRAKNLRMRTMRSSLV